MRHLEAFHQWFGKTNATQRAALISVLKANYKTFGEIHRAIDKGTFSYLYSRP